MKWLKKILIIITLFALSCASAQYVESYEPINVFLETQKLEKGREYILQRDKADNIQALRIFNGGLGEEHIIDSKDPIDPTDGLFVEKHWKKMYKQYAQDTISKYWKKEDFPAYNFILENGTGLTLKESFLRKYINSRINEMIILSEPMYYMNKRYIMFYYAKVYFDSSGSSQVIIMKKENGKWVVVREIGDYIYN
ncbi:hypothetical protein [Flavobacterium johnsoniae]|uniref:DUF4440 domain-containing protein n=1 Tax=Flavobacterium johnsoniae TaxID=986 RepID=A0A1J7BP72_FLAJO|nr:hypothetical protein [Flavobacterium johnsoniae]OIV40381.1 hypothetical protein BKM63_15920 [Flavobacterium johnsoniae]